MSHGLIDGGLMELVLSFVLGFCRSFLPSLHLRREMPQDVRRQVTTQVPHCMDHDLFGAFLFLRPDSRNSTWQLPFLLVTV